MKVSMLSFYIHIIEQKLRQLPKKRRPDYQAAYDKAFYDDGDDAVLVRKLRRINEILNQELDAIAMDQMIYGKRGV